MKRRKRRQGLVVEGDIDLTPMIDCIFMLIIFFMVTTVFQDVKGLVVELPSEGGQQEEQQQRRDVNIYITALGDFSVGGTSVNQGDLLYAIRDAMEKNNNKDVIIAADNDARNEDIVYALDMAKGAGAENAAFSIEEGQ